MKVTLHCHSTCSDGNISPEQIVQESINQQSQICAITDHDFVTLPSNLHDQNILYLPSAEFSADDFSNFHILGYDLQNPRYINAIYRYLNNLNDEKMREMIQKLRDQNLDISYEEVKKFSKGRQIDKAIIKQYLIVKKCVSSCREAYTLYTGKNRPAYVKSRDFNAKFLMGLINACGGVPVLAHPTKIKVDGNLITPAQLNELVKQLTELGLKGLEVYNAKNGEDQQEFLQKLCDMYGLIPMIGADYHDQSNSLVLDMDKDVLLNFMQKAKTAKNSYDIYNLKQFHAQVVAPILDLPNKTLREELISNDELIL